MSTLFLLLHRVHENVHGFTMKLNFSEPKIFTGGVAIGDWPRLAKDDQKAALDKDWYLYYSYRNPETGELKRQPNIKAGANKFKTKKERLQILKSLQRNLLFLLEKGFSPYGDNSDLEKELFNGEIAESTPVQQTIATPLQQTIATTVENLPTPLINVEDAFKLVLEIKKKVLNDTSYPGFKSNITRFKVWLHENNFEGKPIATVTKKDVIGYLNLVLQNTSARTRNNTRIDIGTLFQTLVDNEIIKENFVATINVLNRCLSQSCLIIWE